MTEQQNDKHDSRLESLYRKSGGVEPDAGLDRIIRARADQAVRAGRSSNRMPWLGGLATASVAIVAIAVVLQQAPPDGQAPEAFAPEESIEPGAFMAPSMGAQLQKQSQQDVSTDAGRTAPEIERNPVPARSAPIRAPGSLPEPASESRQRREAQAEAEPEAPFARNDSATDRIAVSGARIVAPDPPALESRQAVIDKLRELIAAERFEQAHRLLAAAAELYPDLDLPEDVGKALEKDPDSDQE